MEPSRPTAGPDELRQRAEELWAAKVDQDWATVFRLTDPQVRKGATEGEFVKWSDENEPFRVHSYGVGDVLTDSTEGWVEVKYGASLARFGELPPRNTDQWQKWRFLDGAWYPVPSKLRPFYAESPALRCAMDEEALAERFEATWETRHNRDWPGLYEFVDPRDRDDVTEGDFTEVEDLFDYLSHEVHWVEVIDAGGRVRVSYFHKMTDPSLTKLPARTIAITENWVKVGDEWYRDLKKP